MHINEANLNNLVSLWKKYGSQPVDKDIFPFLHVNSHWPYRCWLDMKANGESNRGRDFLTDNRWLVKLPESAIIPIWPTINEKEYEGDASLEQLLIDKKWCCVFQQMAMYLDLQDVTRRTPVINSRFKVNLVRTPEDIKKWVDIGSHAFAYVIDHSVIENIFNDQNIKVLLGWQDDQAVAAALLYKTHDTIGLHQVGVAPAYQGQGIARHFMQHLLEIATQWQGKHLVLQASKAGQALYESLGFRSQFAIKNYQRV